MASDTAPPAAPVAVAAPVPAEEGATEAARESPHPGQPATHPGLPARSGALTEKRFPLSHGSTVVQAKSASLWALGKHLSIPDAQVLSLL